MKGRFCSSSNTFSFFEKFYSCDREGYWNSEPLNQLWKWNVTYNHSALKSSSTSPFHPTDIYETTSFDTTFKCSHETAMKIWALAASFEGLLEIIPMTFRGFFLVTIGEPL